MLQISQIKQLLEEHLHVYRGTPKGVDYRVVFTDFGSEVLLHSHPADETGEDWQQVQRADFNPSEYKLHADNVHYGGHFHKTGCWEFEQPIVTKVVKFKNPRPERQGYHHYDHYAVIESAEQLTDEDACERAIDMVLALGAGFDGTNAHPVLVI